MIPSRDLVRLFQKEYKREKFFNSFGKILDFLTEMTIFGMLAYLAYHIVKAVFKF